MSRNGSGPGGRFPEAAVVELPDGHTNQVNGTARGSLGSVPLAADLRRRRATSWRCVPLPDGRRDPLDPAPGCEPISDAMADRWLDALAHLAGVGCPGVVPADLVEAVDEAFRRVSRHD